MQMVSLVIPRGFPVVSDAASKMEIRKEGPGTRERTRDGGGLVVIFKGNAWTWRCHTRIRGVVILPISTMRVGVYRSPGQHSAGLCT